MAYVLQFPCAGPRPHSAPRNDSVSSFAAAPLPGAELDQLAHQPRDTRTALRCSVPPTVSTRPDHSAKETPIGRGRHLGSVYFDRLFPMGIAALAEAPIWWPARRHRETGKTRPRRVTRDGAATMKRG